VKPAIRFDPTDRPVETGRLLIHDLGRIVVDSVVTAGKFTIRQAYDYAHKCHWWV
jgi:hypothetical protein